MLPGGIYNEQVVIDELAGPPNFWDEATTRHNVLDKYSADQIFGTDFDRESIMLYAFPPEWTLNNVGTEENEKLSDLDEAFVKSAEMYPGVQTPNERAVELAVAASIQADISTAGEEDLYQFVVSQPGVHTVETQGSTDVVMTLYGPDISTRFIEEDDDGGTGRNARIVADLQPGTYFAQVRHYNPERMGRYNILVYR